MEPNRVVFFVSLHFSCLLWRLLCEIGSLDSLPCISLEHESVFINWCSLSWWPPGAEIRTSWEGLDSGVKCKWAMLSASAVWLSRCGAAFGFCFFFFFFGFCCFNSCCVLGTALDDLHTLNSHENPSSQVLFPFYRWVCVLRCWESCEVAAFVLGTSLSSLGQCYLSSPRLLLEPCFPVSLLEFLRLPLAWKIH